MYDDNHGEKCIYFSLVKVKFMLKTIFFKIIFF